MVNTEIIGATQLVFFNTGTPTVPVWTKIEGQRKGDLKRPMKTIEAHTKDQYPYEDYIYGYQGWGIDLDGVWVIDSTTGLQAPGIRYAQYCWENRVYPTVMLVGATPNDDPVLTYVGTMAMTAWDMPGPYDNLVTYTGNLQGKGAYVFSGQ